MEYAKIGDRLYSPHAVERMGPGGTAPSARNPTQTKLEKQAPPQSPGGKPGPGDIAYDRRGVSPNNVEYVIEHGSREAVTGPNGEPRVKHHLGTVDVITQDNGRFVISVITTR